MFIKFGLHLISSGGSSLVEKVSPLPWEEIATVISAVAVAAIGAVVGGVLFSYQIYSPVLPYILWGASGAIVASDVAFLLYKGVARILKKPVSPQEDLGRDEAKFSAAVTAKPSVSSPPPASSSTSSRAGSSTSSRASGSTLSRAGSSTSSRASGSTSSRAGSSTSSRAGSSASSVGANVWPLANFDVKSQFSEDLWRLARAKPETKIHWNCLKKGFEEAKTDFDVYFEQNAESPFRAGYDKLKAQLCADNWEDNLGQWLSLTQQRADAEGTVKYDGLDEQCKKFEGIPKAREFQNLLLLVRTIDHPHIKEFMDGLYILTMSNEGNISNRSEVLKHAIRTLRAYRYRRDPRLGESQKRTGLTGVSEDFFDWIITTYFNTNSAEDVTNNPLLKTFSFPTGDPRSQWRKTLITKICGTGGHFTNYVNGLNRSETSGSKPIFLQDSSFKKAQGKMDWKAFCRPPQDQNNCFIVSSWVNFAVFLRYVKVLDIDASQLRNAKVSKS